MPDIPTTPSVATRRVKAALTIADANDARSIVTQKGAGWGFCTTIELAPGQRPGAIVNRLAAILGVRVETGGKHVIVYWAQPAQYSDRDAPNASLANQDRATDLAVFLDGEKWVARVPRVDPSGEATRSEVAVRRGLNLGRLVVLKACNDHPRTPAVDCLICAPDE